MKFKRTLNVFIDNFSQTYKLLLFRAIITIIFASVCYAVVYPFIFNLMDSAEFASLQDSIGTLVVNAVNMDIPETKTAIEALKECVDAFIVLLTTKVAEYIWGIILLVVVTFAERFLMGLGNYAVGSMLNDKMALHANTPFTGSLIKNLGKASLYNIIYVPVSLFYDFAVVLISYVLLFNVFLFIPLLIKIMLFTSSVVALIALKMTFTSDLLPALIQGNMKMSQAIIYAFDRTGKKTGEVFSHFLVLILLVIAANVISLVFTFGAGFLLTLPASYILIISFEFVNYCDQKEIKYFIDKNTIVRPEQETKLTREQFFRGDM